MEKRKLSIIIPVYNAETYIRQAVESVFSNLHEKKDCLEIIVVNDGSVDASGTILRDLQKKYSTVLKVINENNGGVAKARNIGLQNATGEFVTFLDGDDVFLENAIDILLDTIKKYPNKDYIVFDYQDIDEKGKRICFVNVTKGLNSRKDLDKAFVLGHYFNTCWGKVMRTDLIKQANTQFPEGRKVGEDVIFMGEVLKNIKTFIIVPKPLYGYRQYKDSTMKKSRGKLDKEHIDYMADIIAYKKDYAVKSQLEESCIGRFYEKNGEIISSRVHFCMQENLDKKQKKRNIKMFVKNSVIKNVLKKNVRQKSISLKRRVVSNIYLSDFLRDLYVELYMQKYKKQKGGKMCKSTVRL